MINWVMPYIFEAREEGVLHKLRFFYGPLIENHRTPWICQAGKHILKMAG
jgi:hypothetical protein